MGPYRLVYAADRNRRAIERFLLGIPRNERVLLVGKLESLAVNPKPVQYRMLRPPVPIEGYLAPHRLRVGDYRIFYDIDESAKTVVLIGIRRRHEHTYR
ncbi:MAG: type II toxin-antitoxin system RelE/ParE family toxin [Nitrospirae bacterium]|nr:type II toxin-antitoxin system RelE/ParE family toxin [Nitrospirota bacterium]